MQCVTVWRQRGSCTENILAVEKVLEKILALEKRLGKILAIRKMLKKFWPLTSRCVKQGRRRLEMKRRSFTGRRGPS